MWISMCKNSGEFVKRFVFMHIKFTIDRIANLVTVLNWYIIQTLLRLFQKLIQGVFGLLVSLIRTFTVFPHKLLLLLLSINLNIINKNLRIEEIL